MGNERFNKFITEVCGQIKFKEVHNEIKGELISHLEEIKEEYINQGATIEEAERQSIAHMGDSEKIGFDLNKVYKKTPEYKTLIITACFITFGVFLQYIISGYTAMNTFSRSVGYVVIGGVLGCFIYLFDYRKLEKYSKYLFIATNAFLIFELIFKSRVVNGSGKVYVLGTSLNGGFLALILFIISLCGILPKLKSSPHRIVEIFGLYILCSYMLILINEKVFFVIFSIIFMLLLIFIGFSKKFIGFLVGVITTAGLYYALNAPSYMIRRLTSWYDFVSDKTEGGYINYQIHKLLFSASFFGNGTSKEIFGAFPGLRDDMIYFYIIYTFGWVVGAAIFILVLVMLANLFKTSKVIKNSYGTILILSITSLFGLEFLISILMNLNLAPIVEISIPFLSYSGFAMVLNMGLIGLICSIYGRKNLSKSLVLKSEKVDA